MNKRDMALVLTCASLLGACGLGHFHLKRVREGIIFLAGGFILYLLAMGVAFFGIIQIFENLTFDDTVTIVMLIGGAVTFTVNMSHILYVTRNNSDFVKKLIRVIFFTLFTFVGLGGIGYFYLNKFKLGFLFLVSTIALDIVGFFVMLATFGYEMGPAQLILNLEILFWGSASIIFVISLIHIIHILKKENYYGQTFMP